MHPQISDFGAANLTLRCYCKLSKMVLFTTRLHTKLVMYINLSAPRQGDKTPTQKISDHYFIFTHMLYDIAMPVQNSIDFCA